MLTINFKRGDTFRLQGTYKVDGVAAALPTDIKAQALMSPQTCMQQRTRRALAQTTLPARCGFRSATHRADKSSPIRPAPFLPALTAPFDVPQPLHHGMSRLFHDPIRNRHQRVVAVWRADNSGTRGRNYPLTITLYNSSGAVISTTNIHLLGITEGSV